MRLSAKKNQEREKGPRHPGLYHLGSGITWNRSPPRGCLLIGELPGPLWLPDAQEKGQGYQGEQAASHINEGWPNKVGNQELYQGKTATANQEGRPDGHGVSPTGHDPDEPCGNE